MSADLCALMVHASLSALLPIVSVGVTGWVERGKAATIFRSCSPAGTGDILDARLREGNAYTAEGALKFILDLVDRVEGALCQVALARIDAGFPDAKCFAAWSGETRPMWPGGATTRS